MLKKRRKHQTREKSLDPDRDVERNEKRDGY
jgi:hypothetical protein